MIVDLCSGIGRWPTDEEVISIDASRKTHPTIVADVRYLPLRPKLNPRYAHASPPCNYFNRQRWQRWGLDASGIAAGLKLVSACLEAFDYLGAQTWTLESPEGVLRRVMPMPTETIAYANKEYRKKSTDFWASDSRMMRRAEIPEDVRQRLLEASLSAGTGAK